MNDLPREHYEEMDRIYCTMTGDKEALSWASALMRGKDDIDEVLHIPEVSTEEAIRMIPERFRASFDRLPEHLKPEIARGFRRMFILYHTPKEQLRLEAQGIPGQPIPEDMEPEEPPAKAR